jgi:hypothetical protein
MFRDVGNRLGRNIAAARDFREICKKLSNGEELLPRHYRARIDDPTSPDPLLESHGIKHLHLVRQNSDDILYCIEYPRLVLMLQVSGHVPLDNPEAAANLAAEFHKQAEELSIYQALGRAIRALGVWLGIARKK